jgi:hypothetical protein
VSSRENISMPAGEIGSGPAARTRRTSYSIAVLVLAFIAAFAVTGCRLSPPAAWDGAPWTTSHPEPCRKYAPITSDWVAAHPGHPCAQLVPAPPATAVPAADLGPACSIERGGQLECAGGSD